MRKILSVFLALALVLSLPASFAFADEEPYELIIVYPVLGVAPTDLDMIEDAVNAISVPEINVKISFYPMGAFDITTQANLMIASGEQLDLVLLLLNAGTQFVHR